MIDYLMVRKTDCCLVKVISSEECVPQHQLVIGRLVLPMKPQKTKNCEVCTKAQSVEVER